MKKFAIFGNPIKHSLSPIIHDFFSKQTKIKINYKKIYTEKKTLKKNYYHSFTKEETEQI